jgi:integrase
MPKRKQLSKNMYRRRGRIGARIQIDGQRVRLGEWPDTPEGAADAVAAIKQARRDVEDGAWIEPSRVTVGQYAEKWLERRERHVELGNLRRVTFLGDRGRLESGILPHIGRVKLIDLDRDRVERLAVDLRKKGGKNGMPLAPQTVHGMIAALRVMLEAAVETDQFIVKNPARGVSVKDNSRQDDDFDDLATWTAEELAGFLDHIDGSLRQMVGVVAATGIRRSELCGLQWKNVDLDDGVIRIRATVVNEDTKPVWRPQVKSYASRRSIAIPSAIVDLLRERRTDQARQRLAAGTVWSNDLGLVFTWDDGSGVTPNWFTKTLQKQARLKGLEPIGPHGLRHTFATISLENGVPLKNVSDALGHANIGITADVYSHVTERAAKEAAEVVGRAIFGGET